MPTAKPTPTPSPTPGKPACGAFTSDQIAWAAHELGIGQGVLKSAIEAHPAVVCCLPHASKNCHPDKDDLAKLAKQVAALAHQSDAHASNSAKSNPAKSKDADKGKRHDSAGKDDDRGKRDSLGHGNADCGRAR